MISTVLRRSVLGASRRTRTLPASLTSINAALFHHLTPSATTAANVKPPFGIKARDFHIQSGPSEFRASMVSPAAQNYAPSYKSSDGGDSKIEMSQGNVKKKKGGGGGEEESTSKIKGTRICIAIRSFDNPEKQAWCLPPHTRYAAMPDTRTLYTVLRSPHVDKKSREQFEMRFKKRFLVIKAQSHELSKKLFWLKRYRILGAQYELQFHCKTRLDMAPVLGNINGSTVGQ